MVDIVVVGRKRREQYDQAEIQDCLSVIWPYRICQNRILRRHEPIVYIASNARQKPCRRSHTSILLLNTTFPSPRVPSYAFHSLSTADY
jgi:hypothetical protein